MDRKILLIDDSAILRRIATNVLGMGAMPCEVITATRATEGFARACAAGVGLILVDYQLAGLPHAELCQRLLGEPRMARVPVILLLGPGMQPPSEDALPGNVVATLFKPFTPEQLVGTIGALFEMARADASLSTLREHFLNGHKQPVASLTDQHEAAVAAGDISAGIEGIAPLRALPAARRHVARTSSLPPAERLAHPARPLRAALLDAAARGRTGVLRFCAEGACLTELYLDGGQIVVVTTHDAEAYSTGAAEVLPPKVSPATLESALLEQVQSGVPFFLTLGTRGVLSKAAATMLLHRFGQRHFAHLWTQRDAPLTIDFEPLEALPGFALRLEPRREGVDEWLLATLRLLQTEDIAALMRHEGLVGMPSYNRGSLAKMDTFRWTEEERDFARRVNGRHDLPTVAKALGVTTEFAFLLLFRFRCMEIMDYQPSPPAFVVTPRTNVRRVLPLRH